MQVIEIEREDNDFFCPVTGLPVFDQSGEPAAPTVRGLWVNEIVDEPFIWDEKLQQHWDEYLASLDEDEDVIDMPEFLAKVEAPGWVAFEITVFGFACGPVWSTSWTVLDLGYHKDEVDDEFGSSVEASGVSGAAEPSSASAE